MSKAAPAANRPVTTDLTRCIKSTFTLTFAVEIVGIEVWHDCNEGWLDLGPCSLGLKLQYQLYYGQTFDVDILIWPHAAKIWAGAEYCWVRTWQLLERRWLTFSIRHAFPVRAHDLRGFAATISPSFSIRSDKNTEVYVPQLKFGERRYFAPVLETMDEQEPLRIFIRNLFWKPVEEFIPPSFLDGKFGVPYPVKDIRHQDAVLYHVKETILNNELVIPVGSEETINEVEDDRKAPKDKDKKKTEGTKNKFEISLSGDTILAGSGRIVAFEPVGDRPSAMGEIIVLISSNNLPAQDDVPILFVNIGKLFDVPIKELKKLRISHIYTRWVLGEEVHDSQPQDLREKRKENIINFNDHHAMLLDPDIGTEVTAVFLDNPYEIQIRGIRSPPITSSKPTLFGHHKNDRDLEVFIPPKVTEEDVDILIALIKIDAKSLAKGLNGYIQEDCSVYPPRVSVVKPTREDFCTNDINLIGASVKPELIVPTCLILKSQMMVEISMGLVGCKPKKLSRCFSRLYCTIKDSESIMEIMLRIQFINEKEVMSKDELLTGFALDTGDVVLLFVEGPRDGHILKIWDLTEDFYPKIKPVYSSSARYSTRIYPELLTAAIPFMVLKMYAPLGMVLACPAVYVRPALPLPTRAATLKLGRLLASRMRTPPNRSEMPTADELKSFRIELCAPPRPPALTIPDIMKNAKQEEQLREIPEDGTHLALRSLSRSHDIVQSPGRINWEKNL